MLSCLSLDFLYRASRINGFSIVICQINSITNINPIMPSLIPLTFSKANSLNYARADSLTDLRIDFKLDLNINSLVDMY
jgi:hypothetical protein